MEIKVSGPERARRSVRAGAIAGALIGLMCGLAAAQADPLDPQTAAKFAEVSVPARLAGGWMPGAVVAVVHGGQLVALKGYGVTEIGKGSPVDPNATLFRIGSITKLMTTVAALRFGERGELDADRDISAYLRAVHIPESFPEPVTAKALMTHRGGFETQIFHLAVADEAMTSMSAVEMQREVVRVRPVTSPPMYDNLGFGILGIVLSDIAQQPFDRVLTREVFDPLGMKQSYVGMSGVPREHMASCHMPGPGGQVQVCPQVYIRVFGQGGGDVSSTGADMAQFMLGLLEPGRLLEPATHARMMNFDTERAHPRLEGLGLAIVEMTYGGRRGSGHRGEVNGFVSKLVLFPQIGAGIFISVNGSNGPSPLMKLSRLDTVLGSRGVPGTAGPDEVIDGVLEDFAKAFVPAPNAAAETTATPLERRELTGARLAGSYFRTDATASLLGRLLAPLSAVQVVDAGDGRLRILGLEYRRTSPMFYEPAAAGPGPPGIAFSLDAEGQPLASGSPYATYPRQPWYARATWSVLPLPFLTLLLLTSGLPLLRQRTPFHRRTFAVIFVSAAVFLAALLLELQFGHLFERAEHPPVPPLAWRIFFPLTLVGFSYGAFRAIRMIPAAGTFMKTYLAGLALAAIALIWLSIYWQMPELALR